MSQLLLEAGLLAFLWLIFSPILMLIFPSFDARRLASCRRPSCFLQAGFLLLAGRQPTPTSLIVYSDLDARLVGVSKFSIFCKSMTAMTMTVMTVGVFIFLKEG
jgi:hypothetical protein